MKYMIKVLKFAGKIIHKGEDRDMYYLDQLNKEIRWVYSRRMKSYLLNNYNLTPEEYYNLVVYGDKDYKERCKYCNQPKENFWKLSYGYRGDFCCHSCARSYHLTHPGEYPLVQEQFEEFNRLGIENAGWNQGWSNTKKARTQFLNKGSLDDICIFYLAITSDLTLKFGITNDELGARAYHNCITGEGSYLTIHEILTDSRLRIANFEALLKYKFDHSEYHEFSKLHDIIKEIKYLRNINLNDYPY